MTLNIDISGELAAALQARAQQQGLPAERSARRLLAEALTPAVKDEAEESGEEMAKAFVEWARSHRDTPPLSDEAVSRAGMYPDRW